MTDVSETTQVRRRVAGLLVAPAALVMICAVGDAIATSPPISRGSFPRLFVLVLLAYGGSAAAGGLSWAAARVLKPPHRAEVVVLLLALSAAALGILAARNAGQRSFGALLFAISSLPVSITYCLVAGVPAANLGPIRERPGRTLAAALLAPATLVLLDLVRHTGYLQAPGHLEKYFPDLLTTVALYAYAASALVGALATALRLLTKAPLRAGIVVLLFALSAAPFGLLMGVEWMYRPMFALLAAALTLPVSLTYCAIAGIRWR
ncbi:hypothetical protein [Phenylobacterium sp.]|uniref:hypothetical protein n=1 Tax=Phenylobacterium sp. TaxID=1871053 RepID=UPI0025E372CE|nr:hypothetical protein [Phenylobacterium sp.]MBX3483181.1 hypothetical protein [Phenylobacterium sp.]MCW5760549.1 hypothetical protein [Phenylobacterium sp.]